MNELSTLNAIGNGALQGSMGEAGFSTGLLAPTGCDMSLDATNSMGGFTDDETGGTDRFEVAEELDDFTASKTGGGKASGAMGSFAADSEPDNGTANELNSLGRINANDFSA